MRAAWRTTTSPAKTQSSASSEAAPRPAAALDRLEFRVERLDLTFRFTYAFHAREVRFECDRGRGFERVFPETFSFRADRHDPAEIYLQLDDLVRKPRLLSPRASPRDAEILVSRLLLGVPRYLEHLLERLEEEARVDDRTLTRIHEDVALLAQLLLRFLGSRGADESPGLRIAGFHLRKLAWRSLHALVERRVEPEYLKAFVEGRADPMNAADDLSESGFFLTMEGGSQDAINRSLLRLCERAFYRWLEDVCLDEENGAFEQADSPFAGREGEILRAIGRDGGERLLRERELVPFLRRPQNRDCLRVLGKLERWFLRQYDIHHGALVIHHADNLGRGQREPDRVLSHHASRNYLVVMALMSAPFLGGIFLYEKAPVLFDVACATELGLAIGAVVWFLGWRFCWRKNLTFFRASVPRIAAGIIVGYLPIFFIDEVWSLAAQPWGLLVGVSALLAFTTLLYLYIEVQRRLRDPVRAFARARQIFLLGVLQAFGIGLVLTGLIGGIMAARNWGDVGAGGPEALRVQLQPFVGELPRVLGVEPFYTFPPAILLMTFLSFFIGTFLQLMWEDIPLTEPL